MQLVSLREACKQFGEGSVKSALSHFSCEKDLDIQDFIRNKAFSIDPQNFSRTHLYFSDDFQLSGYFTLMVKEFILGDQISKSLRRRLGAYGNGFMCFLIAQLGRDDHFNGIVPGIELVNLAIQRLYKAQEIVGIKCVCVEYTPVPALRDFYGAAGFLRYR